jgi:hypothetical protein
MRVFINTFPPEIVRNQRRGVPRENPHNIVTPFLPHYHIIIIKNCQAQEIQKSCTTTAFFCHFEVSLSKPSHQGCYFFRFASFRDFVYVICFYFKNAFFITKIRVF